MGQDTQNDALIVRGKGGRFAPGTKSPKPITKENSHEYRRRRQEKAEAALRKRILESTQRRSTVPLNGAADAVAEAGGFIWDEIVLGEDVYPRDRLEAWEKIGKYAGILGDLKGKQEGDAVTVTLSAHGLQALAAMLAGNGRQHDTVDGEASDEDIYRASVAQEEEEGRRIREASDEGDNNSEQQ